MRRALKAAALLLLLAATAAPTSAAETASRTVESHTFDHKTTSKKKYDLRVRGGRVRLHVKASVREGRLKLVVRDANGEVRQEAHLTPSKSRPNTYNVDSGEVKSANGVWTVEVELTEAVGSYEFIWTSETTAGSN